MCKSTFFTVHIKVSWNHFLSLNRVQRIYFYFFCEGFPHPVNFFLILPFSMEGVDHLIIYISNGAHPVQNHFFLKGPKMLKLILKNSILSRFNILKGKLQTFLTYINKFKIMATFKYVYNRWSFHEDLSSFGRNVSRW